MSAFQLLTLSARLLLTGQSRTRSDCPGLIFVSLFVSLFSLQQTASAVTSHLKSEACWHPYTFSQSDACRCDASIPSLCAAQRQRASALCQASSATNANQRIPLVHQRTE